MKTETAQRIAALRQLMAEKKLAAYIVPGTDPHASEYMAPHWQEMQWLSGFTGESGTAVVTTDSALLWTDSRYYLQAEDELAGTGVELMRESDVDCPSIAEFLAAHYGHSGAAVGVNPEMYSINSYSALKKQLAEGGLRLESHDLIAPLWTDGRPEMPLDKLYIYKECWSGESTESKLARVRKVLDDKRCDAMVISALDETGWLLNIRGTDVDYTPCVTGYCVVEKACCTLFIDPRKTDSGTQASLKQQGVSLRPYTDIRRYLQQIDAQTVMADGARVNEALYEAVMQRQDRTVRNVSPSPVQVMMSVKNDVEQEGTRRAMKRDGVALTRFFRWLETEALSAPQTELTLAARLHELRAQGENFTDESFCTIAGWQGNGAIVHYHAEPETCARIDGDGVLLLDSGGQYLDGTTDITRTVWVGDPRNIPGNVRHDFTLVLKGHIALAQARFPKGTRGNQLDVLAHQFMWQEGITYGHGTGHGVGHFMGCHEGPANIRTDNNTNPIRKGNIFSDEPGIYRAGEYGIRTENLVLTVPAGGVSERTTGEEYYEFETLTLCFYDTRLIDTAMLTQEEKDWLNNYHERVFREIAPLLSNEEQEYLKTKCRKI
ncbi:MAG: aminopeptidase P family protein [Paludibacteraceae bacterium]|nr:aminopeptidase P family protein [Paludibacteraceae bacterium]